MKPGLLNFGCEGIHSFIVATKNEEKRKNLPYTYDVRTDPEFLLIASFFLRNILRNWWC